jgi:ATP diphosphatase
MFASTDHLARLLVIMSQLRDPSFGCPWDIKQDFASIVPYTLEEAYEVADAIERYDFEDLRGELGDLLFHVVFYSQIACEQDLFDFNDVAKSVCDKLVQRHPHVFAANRVDSEEELKLAWESHKARERRRDDNGSAQVSVLDGIAVALPELIRAEKLQKRAAGVGFDWPEALEVFFKIEEELEEVKQELQGSNKDLLKEEIGDLLFAVVNLSRHAGVDPEQALRLGNKKFESRFRAIEQRLAQMGREPNECGLEELDALWEEVKKAEHGSADLNQ